MKFLDVKFVDDRDKKTNRPFLLGIPDYFQFKLIRYGRSFRVPSFGVSDFHFSRGDRIRSSTVSSLVAPAEANVILRTSDIKRYQDKL